MKNKLKILLVLGITIILLCGCGRPHIASENDNLIIINNTSIGFKTIGISRDGSSGGGMYADESLIKTGDEFGFEIEKFDKVGFYVEITDKDENVILKSERLYGDFKEGIVRVSILEDKNGELYAVVEEKN